jgi:hypothetical protein
MNSEILDGTSRSKRIAYRCRSFLKMKPREIKFLLYTADLSKTQAFYSAIGISWWGGEEVQIGKTGLPLHTENNLNLESLPHLCGYIGDIEFMFRLDRPQTVNTANTGTMTLLYYDNDEAAKEVISKLKALSLFVPG